MANQSTTCTSITIIGATGGTGLALLRQCLRSKPALFINVLVRTPAKLLTLLELSAPPANLHITPGRIQDVAAVKAALRTPSGAPTDVVFSSIGFVPEFNWSLNGFGNVDDQSLCENGTRILVQCIDQLRVPGKGQLLVVVSTTGISTAGRDVPLLIWPIYHGLLSTPHKDKVAMEEVVRRETAQAQRWIIVRPSWLLGDGKGEGKGLEKIRVGVERDGRVETKSIGYTIMREDVGVWVFEEVVKNGGERWERACVSLTY